MRVIELSPGHVWKATPGFRVLAVDGGAVRFECPDSWVLAPHSRYVSVIDQHPPDDRCTLTIAWLKVPPGRPGLPLTSLLDELSVSESRTVLRRRKVARHFRPPLEAAWLDLWILNRATGRETCTRLCLARSDCIQALVVFDFRPEDELSLYGFWKTFMASLTLGDYIEDPATGRKRQQWG